MALALLLLGASLSVVGGLFARRLQDIRDRRARIYVETLQELTWSLSDVSPTEFWSGTEEPIHRAHRAAGAVYREAVAASRGDARRAEPILEHLIELKELWWEGPRDDRRIPVRDHYAEARHDLDDYLHWLERRLRLPV